MLLLWVCLAGGLGATLRFLVDGLINRQVPVRYPLATTVINLSGSLALGLITGLAVVAAVPESVRVVVGTGVLGGYTTFSTASVETVRLLQERRLVAGLANGLGQLIAAVGCSLLGLVIGLALAR